jgi:hypothetical protein
MPSAPFQFVQRNPTPVESIPFSSVPCAGRVCAHLYLCHAQWMLPWQLGMFCYLWVPGSWRALHVGFSFPFENCNQELGWSVCLALSLTPKYVTHLVRIISTTQLTHLIFIPKTYLSMSNKNRPHLPPSTIFTKQWTDFIAQAEGVLYLHCLWILWSSC